MVTCVAFTPVLGSLSCAVPVVGVEKGQSLELKQKKTNYLLSRVLGMKKHLKLAVWDIV
jgi:hypothetical protein